MNEHSQSVAFVLEPADNPRLANLCGALNEHLRQVERRLGVEINNRGSQFNVVGEARAVQSVVEVLKDLYAATAQEVLTPSSVNLFLQESDVESRLDAEQQPRGETAISTR
nr:phosphate starvation-inducible protein PhoH [Gammaproteobacteria bacterium]